MQHKRISKCLSAAARQAIDEHYANPCPELTLRCPEIAGRLDALERCRVATQDLPVGKAANVVGNGLAIINEWVSRFEKSGPAKLVRRSTRPHNMGLRERRTPELVALITELRNKHFAWGRDKIYHRLLEMSWIVSLTIIGLILVELVREGKIKPIEPAKRIVAQDERGAKKLGQKRGTPKRKHAMREKSKLDRKVGDRIRADMPEDPLTTDLGFGSFSEHRGY